MQTDTQEISQEAARAMLAALRALFDATVVAGEWREPGITTVEYSDVEWDALTNATAAAGRALLLAEAR